jgi:hypothetical protein
VSRTHCLSTTVRNCTRDEGGPFEADNAKPAAICAAFDSVAAAQVGSYLSSQTSSIRAPLNVLLIIGVKSLT